MPSDAIFQQNVRGLAAQAVQLAFEAGRAEAALLSESSAAGATSGSGGAPAQNYGQMQERISQRITDNQGKLEALKKQIASQSGAKRKIRLRNATRSPGRSNLIRRCSTRFKKCPRSWN